MIEYPVDVENTLWSIWDPSINAIRYRDIKWPNPDGSALHADVANWMTWLLQEYDPYPIYDPRYYYLGLQSEEVFLTENRVRIYYPLVERSIEDIKTDLLAEAWEERTDRTALYSGGTWRQATQLCGTGAWYTRKLVENRATTGEIEVLDNLEYAMDLVYQIDSVYVLLAEDISNAPDFAALSLIDPPNDPRWP